VPGYLRQPGSLLGNGDSKGGPIQWRNVLGQNLPGRLGGWGFERKAASRGRAFVSLGESGGELGMLVVQVRNINHRVILSKNRDAFGFELNRISSAG
jgi:hypothetical protein